MFNKPHLYPKGSIVFLDGETKFVVSDAPVTYISRFLTEDAAWEIFKDLYGDPPWTGISWERRETAPRYEYWSNDFGQPYTYGRNAGERTYQAQPMPLYVQSIRNMLCDQFYFEGCFLNGYENNRDQLGWHADDDPYIDHSKPIAIITLGQERLIEFKKIGTRNTEKQSLMLEHGSLCLMGAGMQFTHLHRIPKAGFIAKPRISLTFRSLIKKV